jgi:hypothetical protein
VERAGHLERGADRLVGGNDPDTLRGSGRDDFLFAWDSAGGDQVDGGTGTDDCAYDSSDTLVTW